MLKKKTYLRKTKEKLFPEHILFDLGVPVRLIGRIIPEDI